jgi:ABC-type ATPase with predicted acetyltransferase domain
VLELRGLTRRYGDLVALDNLSFTVAEGQMFGFVGPNGAGKTTAMRIVLGVLEPDRGEVRWRGRPVDLETRRRFGYLPEDYGQTFSTQCARTSRAAAAHPRSAPASRRITGMSRSGLRQRPSSGVYRVSAGRHDAGRQAGAAGRRPLNCPGFEPGAVQCAAPGRAWLNLRGLVYLQLHVPEGT